MIRLRYNGHEARDGWQPGEIRDVDHHAAEPLLLSGAWSLVLVAPVVDGPALDRRITSPGGAAWR